MLHRPKSIISSIARWVTRESDDEHAWRFADQHVTPSAVSSAVAQWQAWEQHGTLPQAGGWLDQPLALLVIFDVLSLVRATFEYHATQGADWSKETALQQDLIRWVEHGG